jgi:hypothetical protein
LLFTGWDWASASHAVTILDSAGEWSTAGCSHTPSRTWTRCWPAWPATAALPRCPWRSNTPTAWLSTGCSPPATRCRDRPWGVSCRPAAVGAAGAKQLSFRLASKIALAFLAEFPTPQAANRRARQALHSFADNARHSSPWAAKLYAPAPAGPSPWARLARSHLGLLAHQHGRRPGQAPRRTTPPSLTTRLRRPKRAVARQLFKLLERHDCPGVVVVKVA